MLTTLAVIFVVLLLASIFYGFSIVMRRTPTSSELATERCTLCRKRFDKHILVEREAGDTKVLYFCPDCINGLADEASRKRVRSGISS